MNTYVKEFYIYPPYYCCNRTRQLDWLVQHDFEPVNTKIDDNGRCIWIFNVSKELVDCLNNFVEEKTVFKNVIYKLKGYK